MTLSDGSDLDLTRRQRVLDLQGALKDEYPHALPPGTLLFRCPHCEQVYPLSHFPRNDQRRYGVRTICRACLRDSRPRERHDPDPATTRKRCRWCRVERPTAAFYVDRSQADGYGAGCRACVQARRREVLAARHFDQVVVERREQTLKLCAELGVDYPGYDILRCLKCGEVKPLSECINDWRYASRKKPVCRDCHTVTNNPERKT